MLRKLSAILATLCASTAFAGIYNDATANNSMATAVDLGPYFSNGFSPDVGDASGANTSLLAPWVTVNGHGDGFLYDFYKFTTTSVGNLILDMDYTMGSPNGFDPYLLLLDSVGNILAANDDGGTVAGAGGSSHPWDSFIQLNGAASGQYFVQVGRCCLAEIPGADRLYTLQVQAQSVASPVPEPATLGMMLAGVMGVASAVRRKKRAGTAAEESAAPAAA